jgi:hypothetical protein
LTQNNSGQEQYIQNELFHRNRETDRNDFNEIKELDKGAGQFEILARNFHYIYAKSSPVGVQLCAPILKSKGYLEVRYYAGSIENRINERSATGETGGRTDEKSGLFRKYIWLLASAANAADL